MQIVDQMNQKHKEIQLLRESLASVELNPILKEETIVKVWAIEDSKWGEKTIARNTNSNDSDNGILEIADYKDNIKKEKLTIIKSHVLCESMKINPNFTQYAQRSSSKSNDEVDTVGQNSIDVDTSNNNSNRVDIDPITTVDSGVELQTCDVNDPTKKGASKKKQFRKSIQSAFSSIRKRIVRTRAD